ncbi:MAG TPA: penicillin acylase family protein [Pseudomonadales bacterium]|nr:penicillin acylase family protein [Pseudomonadales bacterium]
MSLSSRVARFAPRLFQALALLSVVLVVADLVVGARARSGYDPDAFVAAAAAYDAEIVRDPYGVPHIFGARDADVAFGLAVAHAEDDIATIESTIPMYRAQAGRYQGFDALPVDYLVQWLGARDAVEAGYETRLGADVRAVMEGYAAGMNWYAATHPGDVDARLYPITAQDLVTAFSVQHLFFYGFQRPLGELFADARQRDIADGPQEVAARLIPGDVPVGSNAIAVAASRSTDDVTRLLGNSHQPLEGPLSWYEVQLESREGWKIRGGLFPGTPLVTKGVTPTLGWGVTVNQPDLVDVFVLEIDPEDENRYRLDGEWVEFERRTARLQVKLIGNLHWTVEREIIESVHGPALRTDHGVYALRFAGHREIRQPEQWYRMNKARTFDEWQDAMRLGAIASFNFVYADAEGHIAHYHNSRSPIRAAGWDWTAYLPGDRSDLIWTETQGFDANPQVVDPASGYVLSANQDPFRVTDPADDADRDAYAPEFGYPTRMTNRADRGLELLAADTAISRREFEAIKFDTVYATNSRAVRYIGRVLALDYGDAPELAAAQATLAGWDLSTEMDNRQAMLGVCVLSKEWVAEQARKAPPDPGAVFETCVADLREDFGGVEVRWGEVNRLRQGAVDLPVAGGPDTLRAIYATDPDGDGVMHAVGGDGLYFIAEWDANGDLDLRTVHQYGAATTRPDSKHYSDQAMLYAAETFKEVWFDEAEVRAVAESVERVPTRASAQR